MVAHSSAAAALTLADPLRLRTTNSSGRVLPDVSGSRPPPVVAMGMREARLAVTAAPSAVVTKVPRAHGPRARRLPP
ncbi:MAG TPA: hypothetical protein VFS59_02975 [Gemmatimonadaceae bacterium]|nr:hypothetical protein [Gemmatimonadaceae bacterium]